MMTLEWTCVLCIKIPNHFSQRWFAGKNGAYFEWRLVSEEFFAKYFLFFFTFLNFLVWKTTENWTMKFELFWQWKQAWFGKNQQPSNRDGYNHKPVIEKIDLRFLCTRTINVRYNKDHKIDIEWVKFCIIAFLLTFCNCQKSSHRSKFKFA